MSIEVRNAPAAAQDIDELIGTPAPAWWRRVSTWIGAVLLIGAVAGIGLSWSQRDARAQPTYVTAPVTRRDPRMPVTANGTLQPTRTINIGSELSGTVSGVFVDINDSVKQGQVLVQLDTAKLRDQIARSRAS